jgi:hypothetical protein
MGEYIDVISPQQRQRETMVPGTADAYISKYLYAGARNT